jgi:hypothetical protein
MHYYSDFVALLNKDLFREPQATADVVFLSINSYLNGKVFNPDHCSLDEFVAYKGRERQLKYDFSDFALKGLFADHFIELIARDDLRESALVRGIFSFGLAGAAMANRRHFRLDFPCLFWFLGCVVHLVLRVTHQLYLNSNEGIYSYKYGCRSKEISEIWYTLNMYFS